jgi:hypothetical protein
VAKVPEYEQKREGFIEGGESTPLQINAFLKKVELLF